MVQVPLLAQSSAIAGRAAGPVTPGTSTSPRRVVALGAAALLSIALVIAAPAASAATTQTATCVDGGGVRWNSKAEWGAVYTAASGTATVTMNYAGWTTTKSGTVTRILIENGTPVEFGEPLMVIE